MGRHLPIYVPDSESRNCLEKAKSPFHSMNPRSYRCFAQPGDKDISSKLGSLWVLGRRYLFRHSFKRYLYKNSAINAHFHLV